MEKRRTVSRSKKSPLSGHLEPTLGTAGPFSAPEPTLGHSKPFSAPEGDDLPSPMPTLAKRSSTRIKSKPVRFHEDETLFTQTYLTALEDIKDNMAFFEYIEEPVSALCAFYSEFQQRHFDYDSHTIEDEHPLVLTIHASSKDVLTVFEARKYQDFAEFKTMMMKKLESWKQNTLGQLIPVLPYPLIRKSFLQLGPFCAPT